MPAMGLVTAVSFGFAPLFSLNPAPWHELGVADSNPLLLVQLDQTLLKASSDFSGTAPLAH